MKRHTSALLSALVIGLATLAPPAAAEAPPEAVAAVERFHQALAAGDGAQALAALDPDVVIFEAGGAELSRLEYASYHLAADMEYVAAVQETRVERRSGGAGDVAWVLTQSQTKGNFQGQDIAAANTETMVLHRAADGAWQIVHIHWSSQPETTGP